MGQLVGHDDGHNILCWREEQSMIEGISPAICPLSLESHMARKSREARERRKRKQEESDYIVGDFTRVTK